MGVSKVVTVVCDYSGCKGPAVLQWDETAVSLGKVEAPEASKYLVLININGTQRSFCCQLHAAEYFLPPGYEAKQKQVIELPSKRSHKKKETEVLNWKELPLRSEAIEQADGSPDNE